MSQWEKNGLKTFSLVTYIFLSKTNTLLASQNAKKVRFIQWKIIGSQAEGILFIYIAWLPFVLSTGK